MSPARERAFARLLRWYPRRWRTMHGAVLLSTLLDAADHEGRSRPSRGETADAALHGIAARLDRRCALALALVAVTLAAASGVAAAWAITGAATIGVSAGAVPALVTGSLVAAARSRGILGDGQALAVLATATIGWVLNALAVLSWSLAFDAADDGVPATGLAAAGMPLIVAGLIAGALAVALVVTPVLRRTPFPAAARIAVGGVAGAVATPLLALGALRPVTVATAAIGALVVALLPVRRVGEGARPSPVTAAPAPDPRRTAAVRLLGGAAAVGGTVGVVYALTGVSWSVAATDGTVAMGQGITLLLLSAIPLCAGVGLASAGRASRIAPRDRWMPLGLVVVAAALIAVGYLDAPDPLAMQPWLALAAIAAGVAVAWAIVPRVRLPLAAALTLGILSGATSAAFLGWTIAPMLSFAVPIAGLVLAGRRSPGRSDARADALLTAGVR